MPYLIIYFCYYFGLIKDIVYNLCKLVTYFGRLEDQASSKWPWNFCDIAWICTIDNLQ